MVEEIASENGQNSNSEGLVTLTLTLDQVILYTIVHHSLTSTHMPNFIEVKETFCGRMDVGADGRTDRQLKPALLDRLCRRVDLKKYSIVHATTNKKYRSYHLQQCGHGPRCSAVQPHLGRTAPQRPHTTCTSPDRQ